MNVKNRNGKSIDFNAAINYMDNEIREMLHAKLAPCSNQTFFTLYEKEHKKKHREEWELSKCNPAW